MAAYFNSSANRRSTASLSSNSSTTSGGIGTFSSGAVSSAVSIPHSPSAPPSVSFSSILSAEDEENEELCTKLTATSGTGSGSISSEPSGLSLNQTSVEVTPKARGTSSQKRSELRSRRSLSCEVQQLDLSQSNEKNLAVASRDQQARRHSFLPIQSEVDQIMPTAAAMSETGPTSREKVLNFVIISTGVSLLLCSLPLPSVINGFLLGVFISCYLCYFLIVTLTYPMVISAASSAVSGGTTPAIVNKAIVPPSVARLDHKEDAILKHEGFLNETYQYSPLNHRISQLKSIYVKLDSTAIRLYRPCKPAPKKSSSFEVLEPENFVFNHVRVFDLMGAKVSLLPNGLSRKRRWSRKFPIKLKLVADGEQGLTTSEGILEPDLTRVCAARSLYLFGRTAREKEDWFHRLSVATGSIDKFQRGFRRIYSTSTPLTINTSVRLKRSNFDSTVNLNSSNESGSTSNSPRESAIDKKKVRHSQVSVEDIQCKYDMQYHTFMTAHRIHAQNAQAQRSKLDADKEKHEIITATSNASANSLYTNGILDQNGKGDSGLSSVSNSGGTHIEWPLTGLNMLIARLVWDAMRQKRWLSFVANKIQNKLATIKVPYFIDAITLVGLDLGSCLPILVKSRDTKANEQGLWTSIDFKYSGGFALTVETRVDLHKFVEAETSGVRDKNKADSDVKGASSVSEFGDLTGIPESSNINGDSNRWGSRKSSGSANETIGSISMSHQIADRRSSGHSRNSMDSDEVLDEDEMFCGDLTPSLCDDEAEDSGESSDDAASELLSLLEHNPATQSFGSLAKLSDSANASSSGSLGDNPTSGTTNANKGALHQTNAISQALSVAPSILTKHAKVFSALDKVVKSETVRKLKEKEFVKTIIKDISKTNIVLTVQVQKAQGAIVVNIPPPPTQSLWWGFDSSTDFSLDVCPKLGEKMIKINTLCNLIGVKLSQEVKKILFYPNMDDIPLDILI